MERVPAESEEGLLARFRRGDEEAFRALFDRYQAVLERAIGRRFPAWLQRRLAVSDVIQETRLVAFGRRADFAGDGPEACRRWVLGIGAMKVREAVRHHAGTARRSVGMEVTRGRRIDTDLARAADPSPSAVAISHEAVARARLALERLPEDYREVIRLTREEGLTLVEVGGRMGRSPDAVRMLVGRAIRRFKEVYEALADPRHPPEYAPPPGPRPAPPSPRPSA